MQRAEALCTLSICIIAGSTWQIFFWEALDETPAVAMRLLKTPLKSCTAEFEFKIFLTSCTVDTINTPGSYSQRHTAVYLYTVNHENSAAKGTRMKI